MDNKLYLSQNLTVEVGVAYSKFVKLYVNNKNFTLSERQWIFVTNKAAYINKQLEKLEDFNVEISPSKRVKMNVYEKRVYVSFCEDFEKDGNIFTKYCGLTLTDWEVLLKAKGEVLERMSQAIAYRHEDGEWSLIPNGAISVEDGRVVNRQLVGSMGTRELRTHLAAFLIRRQIKAMVDECKPAEDANTGTSDDCVATWPEQVARFFDTAAASIYLDDVLRNMKRALKQNIATYNIPDEVVLSEVKQWVLLSPEESVIPEELVDNGEHHISMKEWYTIYWITFQKLAAEGLLDVTPQQISKATSTRDSGKTSTSSNGHLEAGNDVTAPIRGNTASA